MFQTAFWSSSNKNVATDRLTASPSSGHTHTHAHITRWQSLLSCPLLSCGLEIKSEMACNQIEIVAKCNSVLPLCSVHRVCIVQLKAGVDVVRMKTGGLVCVSPSDASSKITVIDLPWKEKQLAEAHSNMGKSLLSWL